MLPACSGRAGDDPGAAAVCAEFVTTCISAESMYEDAFTTALNDEEFAPLAYRLENGKEIPVWNLTLQDGVAAALSYQARGALALPRSQGSDFRYVDSTARGYTIARFGAAEARVEMVAMGDVTVPFEQAPAAAYRAFFSLPLWEAGEEPSLSGPDFSGTPPFPYG